MILSISALVGQSSWRSTITTNSANLDITRDAITSKKNKRLRTDQTKIRTGVNAQPSPLPIGFAKASSLNTLQQKTMRKSVQANSGRLQRKSSRSRKVESGTFLPQQLGRKGFPQIQGVRSTVTHFTAAAPAGVRVAAPFLEGHRRLPGAKALIIGSPTEPFLVESALAGSAGMSGIFGFVSFNTGPHPLCSPWAAEGLPILKPNTPSDRRPRPGVSRILLPPKMPSRLVVDRWTLWRRGNPVGESPRHRLFDQLDWSQGVRSSYRMLGLPGLMGFPGSPRKG